MVGPLLPPAVRLLERSEVLDQIADLALGKHRGERRHPRGAAFAGFDAALLEFFQRAGGGHQGQFPGGIGFEDAGVDCAVGEGDDDGFEALRDLCIWLYNGLEKVLKKL